jgi:GAF domain-containing protein
MLIPPIPSNESFRLQALQALNIIDSPPDERIELLINSAAHAFNVPICLVTLVDKNRQWFKSVVGLDIQETPRYMSFCAHAICENITSDLNSHIFEIRDTSVDVRFIDNPLVIHKPWIRFYAGYILQSITHLNLGTVCLIDTKPRTLTDFEKQVLIQLGGTIESLINGYPYSTE